MNVEFQYNPAHPIGTCAKCGEEMVYNVPRLGPNGGHVHKATGSYECKTVAAPSDTAPVEVRCSEWVEELAKRLERRIKPVVKGGIHIPLAGGDADAAIRETIRILIEELRACAESSSNAVINDCEENEHGKH